MTLPGLASKRRAAVLAAVALASSASAVALCQTMPDEPLDFRPLIEAKHPGVPWVSTASLAGQLRGDPPLLLDVRTEAEFEVGHIPGARRVEPGSEPEDLDLGTNRPVVVYCSVGFRSADFARKLRARGVEARNVAGGIFQWANEGRALVKGGNPTVRVHPYDSVWGRLLHPAHRAPLD